MAYYEWTPLTNWAYSVEKRIQASRKSVWALLQNVENWKKWDRDVATSSLDAPGTFRQGATGVMTLRRPLPGGRTELKFKLEEVKLYERFTYSTVMGGSTFFWSWTLRDCSRVQGVTIMKVDARVEGITALFLKLRFHASTITAVNEAAKAITREATADLSQLSSIHT
jgi:hypothetical protein